MVNEMKRRQMLWLIKRASSLTAWKRFEKSFISFVEEFEAEVKRSPHPDTYGYKQVLDAQIDLQEGLEKLAQGDKSVFQYRNEFDGYISDLSSAFNRVFGVILGLNPDQGYDYSNFDELDRLWCELKWPDRGLTQDYLSNDGVEYAYASFARLKYPEHFGPLNFPPDLPAPPDLEHDTLVQSHEPIPEYGIWEPVKILSGPHVAPEHEARLKEWMDKFGHPPPDVPVRYQVDIIGCPSYLLQGAPAPTCYLENGDGYRSETPQPVTWRLLWKDNRYIDGTIPEEEKLYFVEATPTPDVRPAPGKLRAEPNEVVPKTGWWHSPAKPNGQALHYFEAGQRFPDINSTDYGSVIWGYDPDEQKEPPTR